MALVIRITPGSATPIYKQIVDQVRHAAATGHAPPGEALPSVRGLAEELVINPNTVARAYGELVRDGVAESQAGKAVVIAPRRQIYTKAERLRRLDPALVALVQEAQALGFSPEETQELLRRKWAQSAEPITRSSRDE